MVILEDVTGYGEARIGRLATVVRRAKNGDPQRSSR
jgi:hypothetical protein